MSIDELNFDDSSYISSENSFLKKYKNVCISEDQFNILKKYNIDVYNYKDLQQLIFAIETVLNNSPYDLADLEYVSESLSERNYYSNINK